MPSASGLSPAAGRSWWESVRTMSASMCASPASLFAPDTPCRSRYRDACSGFTAEHRYPAAISADHPRAAVGLDPDQYLRIVRVIARVRTDQPVQLRHPGHALGQPLPRQHLPGLVHHLDVVMVLRPVITHEQPHQLSRQQMPKSGQQPAGEPSAT